MRFRASCSEQFIAHLLWEGNIHHVIAVDVPDFAFADHIFHAAEAMRRNRHICLGCDCFCDPYLCAFYTQTYSFPLPNFLHNSPRVSCSIGLSTLNISTSVAT
jgi:hypothetical protein